MSTTTSTTSPTWGRSSSKDQGPGAKSIKGVVIDRIDDDDLTSVEDLYLQARGEAA
jgi:hypothetical protein